MNESIQIINSVELIPLEDTEVNPFLTRVRIKVFHLGENRNHSYIDKPTALNMAKTLRGNPIVARYREEDKDFTDHGEEITINDKGVNFKVLTRPYGFVDLNAKVWFEDFDDVDENGQVLRHTYMVTEGMIWTHAYEELKNTIMKGGRPQSMELDPETIQGEWTNKINPNYEIFIINDAIITKLCALGENTEPCFIGSSIVPIFSELEKEGFVKELLDFKTKFNLALKNKEGGNSMETQNTEYVAVNGGVEAPAPAPIVAPVETATPEPITPAPVDIKPTEQVKEDELQISSKTEDKIGLDSIDENDNTLEEFVKKNSDEEEKKEDDSNSSDDETGEEDEEQKKKVSKNSLEEKFALLEQQFNDLQDKYAKLEEENSSLVAFKAEVEDKEKDALINSFYMLSDEDKKEVIENKSKFTLDDIEKELSVICVRKKVNFNLEEEKPQETNETVPTTFNIDDNVGNDLPAWLKAVADRRNEE